MNIIETNSKYTIYKTTVGHLESSLRDLTRRYLHMWNNRLVEDIYRRHYSQYKSLDVSMDEVIWDGVVCTYRGDLLSQPEMFVASLICNPDTTIYLVIYHEMPDTLITLNNINQISDRMDIT